MNPAARLFLILGTVNVALAVLLGAFGAHALKARLSDELLRTYETGNFYHFVHALGLVLVGLALGQLGDSAWLRSSGVLMLAGIVFFSGSLYILSATGGNVLRPQAQGWHPGYGVIQFVLQRH